MAFKLLKHIILLSVLLGLALADYGAASSEVIATPIHGRQGDHWIYHDNSSTSTLNTLNSSTAASAFDTDTHLFNADLTNIILQEPGFVLLSLSFVLISGGMVFL
ncbi:hypothetical protein V8C37DRAFT_367249 [Trichoderma ceciliae]